MGSPVGLEYSGVILHRTERGRHAALCGQQFLVRNVALFHEFELTEYLVPRHAEVLEAHGAGDKEQALLHVRAGGGVVAEGEALPDVCKEFGGRAAAVDGVKDADGGEVGVLHALAEPPAYGELALAEVHVLSKDARLRLDGVHAYLGAHVPVDLAPGQGGQGLGDRAADLVEAGRAAVEDLDGRGGEEPAIVLRERDITDALGSVG